MMVATVEKMAPAAAGQRRPGAWAARAPMAAMVAVLEMKPDAKPATGRPKRVPASLTAMIRQDWQHNQCGGGEDQGIPGLIFSPSQTRKTVERRARVEQYCNGHCDARGEPRPGHRNSAEHCH